MKSCGWRLNQAGHRHRLVMVRQLGSYPLQNGLGVALRELGRIERTPFALGWMQNVELRRCVQRGLYKGEAKNPPLLYSRIGWASSVIGALRTSTPLTAA